MTANSSLLLAAVNYDQMVSRVSSNVPVLLLATVHLQLPDHVDAVEQPPDQTSPVRPVSWTILPDTENAFVLIETTALSDFWF